MTLYVYNAVHINSGGRLATLAAMYCFITNRAITRFLYLFFMIFIFYITRIRGSSKRPILLSNARLR